MWFNSHCCRNFYPGGSEPCHKNGLGFLCFAEVFEFLSIVMIYSEILNYSVT